MLKLMYITNNPDIATVIEKNGVDRIFVDLEYIGKSYRQGGMDTVQSHHTLDDVKAISGVLTTAELLVRINPIHNATDQYCSSKEEIDTAIANGADILMLPYYKTVDEVKTFLNAVNGRAKTMLLLETAEAVEIVDDVLELSGIDYMYVGLNDLSLSYGMNFMFKILTNGLVEKLCDKFKQKGIPFGFGGIAALGKGAVPAEMVIKEHYRLGSTCAILARSFCNVDKISSLEEIEDIFNIGIKEIRELEKECQEKIESGNKDYFAKNQKQLKESVDKI